MDSDFRVGPWLVQPSLNLISQNGTMAHLEPKVMQLLVCLAQRAGELVPKEELMEAVWPATFVTDDVLKRSIFQLRQAFGDDAHQPRIIETIPKRGYRLIVPVTRDGVGAITTSAASGSVSISVRKRKLAMAVAVGALLVLVAGGLFWRSRQPRRLTEKETLVLGDFANSTGDAVFDVTLRQGLAVQLEQSPLLNLLSSEQVHQTLRMMGQKAGVRLTPEIGREVR